MNWTDWLAAPVTWNGTKVVSRQEAIRRFVTDGLIPFLESHGYVVAPQPWDLSCRIATGLYKNRGRSCLESDWRFCIENTEATADDEVHFYHILDSTVWAEFWRDWMLWPDIMDEESFRASDRRADIEAYCWTQVELDASPQTRVVNELIGYDAEMNTSPSTGKRGDDPYLRDAVESGQWGGYRKTYSL